MFADDLRFHKVWMKRQLRGTAKNRLQNQTPNSPEILRCVKLRWAQTLQTASELHVFCGTGNLEISEATTSKRFLTLSRPEFLRILQNMCTASPPNTTAICDCFKTFFRSSCTCRTIYNETTTPGDLAKNRLRNETPDFFGILNFVKLRWAQTFRTIGE